MKRLFFVGMALWMGTTPGFAQDAQLCIADARIERDRCVHRNAGDQIEERGCKDRYFSALSRCQRIVSPGVRTREPHVAPPPQLDPSPPRNSPRSQPRSAPHVPRVPPRLDQPLQPRLQPPGIDQRSDGAVTVRRFAALD